MGLTLKVVMRSHFSRNFIKIVLKFELNLLLELGSDCNTRLNYNMRGVLITVILPIGVK